MLSFLSGCGIDFYDSACMHRLTEYLKMKNRFKYLTKSPLWETVFKPLVQKLGERDQ